MDTRSPATKQRVPAIRNGASQTLRPLSAPASLNMPAMIGPTIPPMPYAGEHESVVDAEVLYAEPVGSCEREEGEVSAEVESG